MEIIELTIYEPYTEFKIDLNNCDSEDLKDLKKCIETFQKIQLKVMAKETLALNKQLENLKVQAESFLTSKNPKNE